MSYPATTPVPDVGRRMPQSILIVVVLPAPFGPKNPNISPFLILRFRLETATRSPNLFVRLKVSIMNSFEDCITIYPGFYHKFRVLNHYLYTEHKEDPLFLCLNGFGSELCLL